MQDVRRGKTCGEIVTASSVDRFDSRRIRVPPLLNYPLERSLWRSLLPLFTSAYIICASLRPQRTGTLSSERNTWEGVAERRGGRQRRVASDRGAGRAALLAAWGRRCSLERFQKSKKYPSDLSFSL